MKKLRIGINGFGRIGRIAARIILERKNLELSAINSRADVSSHRYLLKYDSNYGILPGDISNDSKNIIIDGKKIAVYDKDSPGEIPWSDSKVDIVIDATGKFREKITLSEHLSSSVKYVVLSAPAHDDTKTLVLGVNSDMFNPKSDKVISNSSCTTNCLATTLKVLDDNFGVLNGFMTTIHALTDSQNLLDNSHKKEVRLRRSSVSSMIPTSTGSAKDVNKLFPGLSGKIICQAIRIPIPTVSIINLAVRVKKEQTPDGVNQAFITAAKSKFKGILDVARDELVSRDYLGNTHSSIIDPFLTKVIDGNFINVFAWYDNEWGYTCRLVDMTEFIGIKGGLL